MKNENDCCLAVRTALDERHVIIPSSHWGWVAKDLRVAKLHYSDLKGVQASNIRKKTLMSFPPTMISLSSRRINVPIDGSCRFICLQGVNESDVELFRWCCWRRRHHTMLFCEQNCIHSDHAHTQCTIPICNQPEKRVALRNKKNKYPADASKTIHSHFVLPC